MKPMRPMKPKLSVDFEIQRQMTLIGFVTGFVKDPL